MTKEEIQNYAEQLSRRYNPEGLSPYPFDNIQKDKKDLKIQLTEKLPDSVSGIIGLFEKLDNFVIFVNKNKPATKRNFTIACELGHYFLHQKEIKKNLMIIDQDEASSTKLKIEASSFAASFLMPADIVKKAWGKLKDVEECAQVFNVPVEAMTTRLSRLGLVI